MWPFTKKRDVLDLTPLRNRVKTQSDVDLSSSGVPDLNSPTNDSGLGFLGNFASSAETISSSSSSSSSSNMDSDLKVKIDDLSYKMDSLSRRINNLIDRVDLVEKKVDRNERISSS